MTSKNKILEIKELFDPINLSEEESIQVREATLYKARVHEIRTHINNNPEEYEYLKFISETSIDIIAPVYEHLIKCNVLNGDDIVNICRDGALAFNKIESEQGNILGYTKIDPTTLTKIETDKYSFYIQYIGEDYEKILLDTDIIYIQLFPADTEYSDKQSDNDKHSDNFYSYGDIISSSINYKNVISNSNFFLTLDGLKKTLRSHFATHFLELPL